MKKEEEIGVEGEMTGVMTVKNWFIQKKGRGEEREGVENFLNGGGGGYGMGILSKFLS